MRITPSSRRRCIGRPLRSNTASIDAFSTNAVHQSTWPQTVAKVIDIAKGVGIGLEMGNDNRLPGSADKGFEGLKIFH
jgi:hypothetical protein